MKMPKIWGKAKTWAEKCIYAIRNIGVSSVGRKGQYGIVARGWSE